MNLTASGVEQRVAKARVMEEPLKRISYLLITAAVLGSLSCRWTPPQTAVRIGDDSIAVAELDCPDRLSPESRPCRDLTRAKMRRLLFDHMLERAVESSGVALSPEEQGEIEHVIERLAPMREQYAQVMKCHATAALAKLGQSVEPLPDCTVDDAQAEQLAENLSTEELEDLLDENLTKKMADGQRTNLRSELLLRKVRRSLEEQGREEAGFWQEIYDSIDPIFYDVDLRMGPAEVMTGDPTAWRG